MPTRYLKPGICDSEAINKCSPLAEILFYRLLVNVDDYGRLDARPAIIRSKCFPLKDSIDNKKTLDLLVELQNYGLIIIYKSGDYVYLQMQKWDNIPRSKESKFPEFNTDCIQMYTDAFNSNTNLPVTVTVTVTETETVNRKPEQKPQTGTVFPEGVKISPPPPQKIKSISSKNSNKDLSPSHETWAAYSNAYFSRYGTEPVRNATVNAQISSFIKRIGFDESPHVASFFVHHNNQFYVQKMHTVGLLLADAEKLRTEWATKKTVTNTQARQADKKQSNANVFNQLIDEYRNKGKI